MISRWIMPALMPACRPRNFSWPRSAPVRVFTPRSICARSLPTDGLEVRVSAEKALGPARLASFQIEVTIPEIEERHREGVLRAVKACLIHNTLLNAPVIGIAVHATEGRIVNVG